MKDTIIKAAEKTFGTVVAVQKNILLINRTKHSTQTPDNEYMTIKGGENENGISFHSGEYCMSLVDAVISLHRRSGVTSSNSEFDKLVQSLS